MGFFKNLFNSINTTQKYQSHPDVLDKIAEDVADTALYQIKNELTKTKVPATYCEVDLWSITLNNKEFESYYTAGTMYSVRFDKFGMEDVPEEDAEYFLEALDPFLSKHLKNKLKTYFPSATSVFSYKTTYELENKWTDGYRVIYAIKIEVKGVENPNLTPKKTLNKW